MRNIRLVEEVGRVVLRLERRQPVIVTTVRATHAVAVRAARAFEPSDIWWFEEPTYPFSLPYSAKIAATVAMPVATGGISEWMKVAHLAAAHS